MCAHVHINQTYSSKLLTGYKEQQRYSGWGHLYKHYANTLKIDQFISELIFSINHSGTHTKLLKNECPSLSNALLNEMS